MFSIYAYVKYLFTKKIYITVDQFKKSFLSEKKENLFIIFHRKNKNIIFVYNRICYQCELGVNFSEILEEAIENNVKFEIRDSDFDIFSKIYSYFPVIISAGTVFVTTYFINKEQSIKIETCKHRPNKIFDEIYSNNLVKQQLINIINKINQNQDCSNERFLILSGPSGTGKTVLANAFANELSSDYIYKMTGFDIIKNNENSNFIKELFKILSGKNAVLFIDEIDLLANDEVLLIELTDTLKKIKNNPKYSNIVFLFATKHLQKINLYFKGFKKICLLLPNENERLEILKGYALKYFYRIDEDLLNILNTIAKESEGMSGSQLEEIFNTMDELYVDHNKQISNDQILDSFYFVKKTYFL